MCTKLSSGVRLFISETRANTSRVESPWKETYGKELYRQYIRGQVVVPLRASLMLNLDHGHPAVLNLDV